MASEGLSTKGRDRDGELVLSVSCESWESVNPESCGGIIKYISGYNKIKGYGVLAKKKNGVEDAIRTVLTEQTMKGLCCLYLLRVML